MATVLHICLGTLAFLMAICIRPINGRPFLQNEKEIFPGGTNEEFQDKLITVLLQKIPGFNNQVLASDLELANKFAEIVQMERIKEQLWDGKDSEISNTVENVIPSNPEKRACFWKYCV
ncbi:urotensin-2B [Protopterus annectens]|uniref:urotensin-2B n=1 Tax=Protopterus annectens TaxID=7888 RepID=UPI001CF9FF6F|nr:urotensin-2B [Protopterus annectens]